MSDGKRLRITIPVEPVGKGRPRTITRGGKTWTFTPKRTESAEALIREKLIECGVYFGEGVPLKLSAIFYRQRPKSLLKRVVLPVTKPDWDNCGKLLTDAAEKFIYHNDAQIVTATIRKRFAAKGETPRIELEIEEECEK